MLNFKRGKMAKESAETKEKKTKRPTPLKRDMQNSKRKALNRELKSKIKSAMRSFEESLSKGDTSAAQENLNMAYSVLDKAVKKGIFKRNKASRTKSRLHAKASAKG